MRLLFFLAIAAVVAIIWFRFKRHVQPQAPAQQPKPKLDTWNPQPRYQAVSVRPGADACEAARALVGVHYVPQDAPRLPLPDCDQKHCDCGYQREAERREAGRRRTDDGLDDIIAPETERRDTERRER